MKTDENKVVNSEWHEEKHLHILTIQEFCFTFGSFAHDSTFDVGGSVNN